MSSRTPGRHRAPAPVRSTTVARTGAVLVVSSGLVAALGLQANAAPKVRSAGSAAAASAAPALGVQASARVPAALVDVVPAAPRYGDIGSTATVAPKPEPKPKPKAKPKAKPRPEQATSEGAARHTLAAAAAGEESVAERRTTRRAKAKRAKAEQVRTEGRRTRSSHRVSRSTERKSRSHRSADVRAGAPGSASFGDAVMSIAAGYAGIMYRYGGTTPAGFDCSGYTSYVLRQVGVSLPRTSSAQRAASRRVSRSEAVPGDLVFMPGHVGIYAGNGQMWDAPRSGKAISKRAIWSSSATFGRVG
ncbi:MAG TPA: C40 family peptidase [Actinomycetales bacterium]|nr:C40 family peptidase [Actinomycetales bacterium]